MSHMPHIWMIRVSDRFNKRGVDVNLGEMYVVCFCMCVCKCCGDFPFTSVCVNVGKIRWRDFRWRDFHSRLCVLARFSFTSVCVDVSEKISPPFTHTCNKHATYLLKSCAFSTNVGST